MTESENGESGLGAILELLRSRYAYDAQGRIVGTMHGGGIPRFVLGRSELGCVWRFRADLESKWVGEVAKLAGREPGLLSEADDYFRCGVPRRPERLVMIERLLQAAALQHAAARSESLAPHLGEAPPQTQPSEALHEWVSHGGVRCAELWWVN